MKFVAIILPLILSVAFTLCAESNAKQSIKSTPRIKPISRRMWTPIEESQLSGSPIFRALNNMGQQADPMEFYPSYSPIHPSMLPRNFYQDPMEQVLEQWMRAQQNAEQRNNDNKEGLDSAIYIPAVANGAFGGPITIVNPQGQQSQEELIGSIGNGNSVESAPSPTGECRSGLQNQQPYYPQFRSPFYQPSQGFYFGDMMGYYPMPIYYPGQPNYYGYP